MYGLVTAVGVLALISFSLVRLAKTKARLASLDEEVQPRPSPVADAIKEMLAVAGGIYISLTALASFLKMNVPPTITLGNLVLDPMALAAVILTVIYGAWPRRIAARKTKP